MNATGGVLRQGLVFASTARCYWLEIFPLTRRELGYWRRRALVIPDPRLRRDALHTQQTKWGHSEGAAAFAVLVPRARRRSFVRMAIAYELMIDYLDTTSERSVADPFANTLWLHRAMDAALALEPMASDYYASHPHRDDGGYLEAHISVCSEIAKSLPARPAVAEELRRLLALYAEAQGLFHSSERGRDDMPRARRTLAQASRCESLRLGEVVAAGGSSLPVLALLAAAAGGPLSEHDARRVCSAYYPWVAALHISLDGVVDRAADRATGRANQIDHYASEEEAVARLAYLASESLRVGDLPQGELHTLLLAGMVGYYLAHPEAWEPGRREISAGVLEAIGAPAKAALFVHRLRQGGPRAAFLTRP
jgi:tetraprenyl-beta-curcumene synthase